PPGPLLLRVSSSSAFSTPPRPAPRRPRSRRTPADVLPRPVSAAILAARRSSGARPLDPRGDFMRIPHRPFVVLMFLLPPVAAHAAPAPPVAGLKRVLDAADPHRIDADLRFLADDIMEGRGTGQKGGRLAALYLETR